MTPEHWQQVTATLAELLDQPRDQRDNFLDGLRRRAPLVAAEVARVLAESRTSATTRAWNTPEPTPTAVPETTPAGTSTPRRFRCPHCHNPLEIADDRSDEVLCPACGSTFRIQDTHATSTASGGQMLGKFQLLERVGTGGFGAVWRAKDTQLNRIVALKILHAGALSSPADRERFDREARAAAHLRHPGIVSTHEIVTLNDLPAIVSDFIDGLTLREYLKVKPPTFQEAARIAAEIADGLHHAHEKGVVHRDIKPANIMMESPAGPARQPARPLIMDLGLALRDDVEITLTLDGQIIGTPAYMSPEQARGHGHRIDRRSDVYSLGVVLYEMLTGELPFRGSKAMIVHQVLREEPRPPRGVNDRIPRDLETICLKCLEKEPARRYADAAGLADDLRRFLNGRPVLARPVGNFERLVRWCRRQPVVAGLTASIAATLVIGTVVSLAFAMQAARKAEDERQARAEADAERQRAFESAEIAKKHAASAERYSAGVALERGQTLFNESQSDLGMLWLAHSLESASKTGDTNLQWYIRANLNAWRQEKDPARVPLKFEGDGWTAMAISGDGRVVLARSDTQIQLWSTRTGEPVAPPVDEVLNEHSLVSFSPDHSVLLVAHRENESAATFQRPRVIDLATGKRIEAIKLAEGGAEYNDHAFCATRSALLLVSAKGRVHVWAKGDRGWAAVGPDRSDLPEVLAAAFSNDGRFVVTGHSDNSVRFWDPATRQQMGTPVTLEAPARNLLLTPDGRILITARDSDNGKTVQLWDVATRQPIGAPIECEANASPYLSPDGRKLLTIGTDLIAHLWDVQANKPLTDPDNYRRMAPFAFSPDSETLLAQSVPKSAANLGIAGFGSGQIGGFTGFGGGNLGVGGGFGGFGGGNLGALGAGGNRGGQVGQLFQGGGGALGFGGGGFGFGGSPLPNTVGSMRLWQTQSGKAIGLPLPIEGITDISRSSFSPDGRYLLLAGEEADGAAWRLYDARTGKPIGPLTHSIGGERAIEFSADGKQLLTIGTDPVTNRQVIERRDLDPITGEPSQIVHWAQVRARHEIGSDGESHHLDEPAWETRRSQLADSGRGVALPDFMAAASGDRLAWAREEVLALEEAKQFAPVIEILGRLIQAESDRVKLVDLHCRRGHANGSVGQFEKALADYKNAYELGDTDFNHRYGEYAHLLAALGKRSELEQLCLEVLDDRNANPFLKADLVALTPMSSSVREASSRPVEKKKEPKAPPGPEPWFKNGRVLYRTGAYAEAAKSLADADGAEDQLFLAMCKFQLRDRAGAREWLAKAQQTIQKKPSIDWVERIRLIVLSAEAEELIVGKNRPKR